eukprot:3215548-Prymnesium_polylepis.1
MDVGEYLAGVLLDGHLYGLVGLLDNLTRFPSRKCSDRGCTLSTWLFHLAGGHDAKLQLPPPGRAKWTLALLMEVEKRTRTFKTELKRLEKETNRPTANAAAWTWLDDHRALAARRDLVDSCVLRLRPSAEQAAAKGGAAAAAAATATTAGGGGNPTPADADAEHQRYTDALYAFLMGTHERLGAGWASRHGPCA